MDNSPYNVHTADVKCRHSKTLFEIEGVYGVGIKGDKILICCDAKALPNIPDKIEDVEVEIKKKCGLPVKPPVSS